MRPRLLIAGASARAAADSAGRAGLDALAIDLFGDRDLRASAALRVPSRGYPRGIPALARRLPGAPFLYTGALENHPRVIERLAAERPLWGNPGPTLRRVRDPRLLAAAVRAAGLPAPRVLPPHAPPPPGEWLEKPLQGGGGRGIRAAVTGRPARAGFYLQERIEGPPAAAVYVAAGGRALLLGLTRQLVGEPGLGAAPFAYCGSIGPLRPGRSLEEPLRRLGDALAREFGLAGLFGVDLVVRDGLPVPVEVNPRYTASVEVLERALGVRALDLHARACRGAPIPDVVPDRRAARGGLEGKAVLFATRDVSVPDRLAAGVPAADLPRPGETIRAGRPVLTVFAEGSTEAATLAALLAGAGRLAHSLEGLRAPAAAPR